MNFRERKLNHAKCEQKFCNLATFMTMISAIYSSVLRVVCGNVLYEVMNELHTIIFLKGIIFINTIVVYRCNCIAFRYIDKNRYNH